MPDALDELLPLLPVPVPMWLRPPPALPDELDGPGTPFDFVLPAPARPPPALPPGPPPPCAQTGSGSAVAAAKASPQIVFFTMSVASPPRQVFN